MEKKKSVDGGVWVNVKNYVLKHLFELFKNNYLFYII